MLPKLIFGEEGIEAAFKDCPERLEKLSGQMSHFLVMIQRGQKFTAPAINGATPRKNQGLLVTNPVVINARPTTIRIGRHTALIFMISITILLCDD